MVAKLLHITAAAAVDAGGVFQRPAHLLLGDGVMLGGAGAAPPPGARALTLPGVVLPGMVNAHAHLDLTPLGARPYGGDFTAWLMGVVRDRPVEQDAAAAVAQGWALSVASGVSWVGDIAGSAAAVRGFRAAGARGRSYLECLGPAGHEATYQERLRDAMARCAPDGLSPHAPTTTSRAMYEHALSFNLPLTTHLAESEDETRLIRDGDGPFADMLGRMGLAEGTLATGLHPIDWFAPMLRRVPWLLAHVHECADTHPALLAEGRASVAYCPIAGDYFGHAPHRYREMLAAGVNVCLGTDSILCQPPDEPQVMGILPAMRYLYQRDGTEPMTLLRMATVNGMNALQLPELDATLQPGSRGGVYHVACEPGDDPLRSVLMSREPMERVW